jgi:putative peptidoglycan lipid II flippase
MSVPEASVETGSRRLVGAASLLAAGNVASRLLGLVREQVIAFQWGGTLEASAFSAAARVPTMIYDLLIGGMLSAALVPVLSTYAATRRDELWRAASVILSTAAAVTGVCAIAVFALAPWIADLLFHGGGPQGVAIVANCLRFIAPAVLAFGLAGILTGILFALERFTLPAIAGAVYNGAFILAAVAFHDRLGIYALPLGVTAGGVAQVAILLPGLRDARLRLSFALRHPALRRVVILYIPIGLGLVVSQAQVAFDTRLASRAGDAALAWMRYATSLIQFPHGLVAVAISLAILPRLSAIHARREVDAFAAMLARALRMVLALSLPAVVGLAILGMPLVGVVFQRGAFGDLDRLAVAVALLGYLVGLPFAAIDWPLNYGYYARQNTLTPALVGIGGVVVYLVVAVSFGPVYNLAGLRPDRVFLGLVLADSAKQFFHATVMLALTRRSTGRAALERVGRTAFGATAAALVMGALVGLVDRGVAGIVHGGTLAWALRVVVGLTIGVAAYIPLARLYGVTELDWLVAVVRDRVSPTRRHTRRSHAGDRTGRRGPE